MDLSAITKEKLHHAYFLEGERERIVPALVAHLAKEGIASGANVSVRELPVVYIDDARSLREAQVTVAEVPRVFVVAFDRMQHEAQQALLKTIEEPTAHTHFFFIGKHRDLLLPTVRSRLVVLRPEGREDTRMDDTSAREFLRLDYYGRLEAAKDLVERARSDDDDEKLIGRRDLVLFLDGLEREIVDLLHRGDLSFARGAEIVLRAKNDMSDSGPSIKMIVEHLALRLPRIK